LSQKDRLVNYIVMQFIDEPFFDDLRTKQQLGYVVQSYDVKILGITGNRFVVQSPQKSCEYLIGAINKFLLEIREKFKNMTDDQFNTNRKSIITQVAEKDITLNDQHTRFWTEINTHELGFTK